MSNRSGEKSEIIEKYDQLMRAFIGKYRMGRIHFDVDDLLQESKIRLMKVLENGHDIRFLESYIRRIVDSIVINHIHEIHRERSFLRSEELRLFDEKRFLEKRSGSSRQDMKEVVRIAIDSLVGSRRIVLNMAMSGFSLREISEARRWTLKKTYNLYERGLKDLKRLVLEKGYRL